MFRSYRTTKSDYNGWRYEINDDDFLEERLLDYKDGLNLKSARQKVASFIIDIYTKRELNVAANLIKFLLYVIPLWGLRKHSVQEIGALYIPDWEKWAPQVEKLLLLI
jgi:hypothetical protein